MNSLLELREITKSFGKASILKGISFLINENAIFGLLGVNGAGKTTMIKILLGLLRPDHGMISYQGQAITQHAVQRYFGFLPENFSPPQHLHAREFLAIIAEGLGTSQKDVDRLMELVGLTPHKKKLIRSFSRGMIQRLGLATCLLKDPQVVVLDEPTLGLDPVAQAYVLSLLKNLHTQGKTIFFCSHILSQIEQVCTDIAILHQGKIRFCGSVQGILTKHNSTGLEEAFLQEVMG